MGYLGESKCAVPEPEPSAAIPLAGSGLIVMALD
jgi:hypothetical protein